MANEIFIFHLGAGNFQGSRKSLNAPSGGCCIMQHPLRNGCHRQVKVHDEIDVSLRDPPAVLRNFSKIGE